MGKRVGRRVLVGVDQVPGGRDDKDERGIAPSPARDKVVQRILRKDLDAVGRDRAAGGALGRGQRERSHAQVGRRGGRGDPEEKQRKEERMGGRECVLCLRQDRGEDEAG